MLSLSGFFNTMKNFENLISDFRELLEKVVEKKDVYFDQSKFTESQIQDNIYNSKKLVKNHYW